MVEIRFFVNILQESAAYIVANDSFFNIFFCFMFFFCLLKQLLFFF